MVPQSVNPLYVWDYMDIMTAGGETEPNLLI